MALRGLRGRTFLFIQCLRNFSVSRSSTSCKEALRLAKDVVNDDAVMEGRLARRRGDHRPP
jgi:hypothetical protein